MSRRPHAPRKPTIPDAGEVEILEMPEAEACGPELLGQLVGT